MFLRRVHFAPESEPTGGGATPPVPAAAAPVAPPTAPPDGDPSWLTPRLERERQSARKALLAEIGVADPAAAAKLVADEAARVEASRSLELRASDSEKALVAERARVAELNGTVTSIAAERMAGLTESQRAAVTAIAGADSAAQLKAITALTPTWAAAPVVAAAAAPAAGATAAPVLPAKPAVPAAGTAPPAAGAPAPGTAQVSQVDHKAEYTKLKANNPHAASLYLNKHSSSIYPSS